MCYLLVLIEFKMKELNYFEAYSLPHDWNNVNSPIQLHDQKR